MRRTLGTIALSLAALLGPLGAAAAATAPEVASNFESHAQAAESMASMAPLDQFIEHSSEAMSPLTSELTQNLAADEGLISPASTYTVIKCVGVTNHPHYSKGAGGAVAKVVVTCKSNHMVPTVNVRVRGSIQFAATASGTRVTRATSDQTQSVPVNSGSRTFYIPLVGKNAGIGNGYWITTSTIQIVSPGVGTVDSKTIVVQKNILPPNIPYSQTF